MNVEVLGKATSDDLSRGKSFEALQEAELQDVEWVVPYTIPEGFTLRAGAPKDGKSALSEWEACVLGASQPVAYFALEYNERLLTQRLRKLADAGFNPKYARFWTQYEVLDSGINPLDFIERMVMEMKPKLTVVDTLAAVKQMTSGSYGEEYAAMQAVKAIADNHDTHLLVNHHSRKRGDSKEDESWVERILGSTGIAASADTVQLLERADMATRLRMKGRMVSDLDQYFSFSNGVFVPQDADVIVMQALEADAPTAAALGHLLRDHDALTFVQVHNYINEGLDQNAPTFRSKGAVYSALKTLANRGLVKSANHKGGVWQWIGPTNQTAQTNQTGPHLNMPNQPN